jgi:hypothetical protein
MDNSIIPTINHRFVGRRQDGMLAPPDALCTECGYPRNQHIDKCQAALTISGNAYQCDLVPPHDGWAHQNREMQAQWQ